MTPAETYTIIEGWVYSNEIRSANFRELFTLTHNIYAKKGSIKTSSQLWPLHTIDKRHSRFDTAEEEYEWRKKMIEFGQKFFKN